MIFCTVNDTKFSQKLIIFGQNRRFWPKPRKFAKRRLKTLTNFAKFSEIFIHIENDLSQNLIGQSPSRFLIFFFFLKISEKFRRHLAKTPDFSKNWRFQLSKPIVLESLTRRIPHPPPSVMMVIFTMQFVRRFSPTVTFGVKKSLQDCGNFYVPLYESSFRFFANKNLPQTGLATTANSSENCHQIFILKKSSKKSD